MASHLEEARHPEKVALQLLGLSFPARSLKPIQVIITGERIFISSSAAKLVGVKIHARVPCPHVPDKVVTTIVHVSHSGLSAPGNATPVSPNQEKVTPIAVTVGAVCIRSGS